MIRAKRELEKKRPWIPSGIPYVNDGVSSSLLPIK